MLNGPIKNDKITKKNENQKMNNITLLRINKMV